VVVSHFVPLQFLRLREGETLASLLLVAGAAALALDLALCRGAHLPAPASVARAIPPALGAVAVLYLCGILLLERDLYHVAISPGRGAIALIVALAVLPFFAFVEVLLPSRALHRVLATALVYGAAALTLALLRARLERFGPALFALGMVGAAIGAAVARASRNAAASPVFSASMTGWIVAVGFLRY
jgi:hypothetical protein